jgi:hypothetical protein
VLVSLPFEELALLVLAHLLSALLDHATHEEIVLSHRFERRGRIGRDFADSSQAAAKPRAEQ